MESCYSFYMTSTAAPAARYRLRVLGSKFDYIRRYGVLDLTTGRRIDGVPGGLVQAQAQEMADDLNGVDIYADEN